MADYELRELRTPAERETALALLRELRVGLSSDDFRAMLDSAGPADGYTLLGALSGGRPVAVMGYRVLHDLVHGRHLYVDDLVVTASERGAGVGALLLREAEAIGRRLQCRGLRLCTGFENEGGRRFYEREGWVPRSIAFKKFPI